MRLYRQEAEPSIETNESLPPGPPPSNTVPAQDDIVRVFFLDFLMSIDFCDETPLDDVLPSGDESPSDDELSSDGESPSDDELSSNGESPSDDELSSNGESPSDDELSSDDELPSDESQPLSHRSQNLPTESAQSSVNPTTSATAPEPDWIDDIFRVFNQLYPEPVAEPVEPIRKRKSRRGKKSRQKSETPPPPHADWIDHINHAFNGKWPEAPTAEQKKLWKPPRRKKLKDPFGFIEPPSQESEEREVC